MFGGARASVRFFLSFTHTTCDDDLTVTIFQTSSPDIEISAVHRLTPIHVVIILYKC